MSSKIKKINPNNWNMEMEIIDTPPTEYIEENIYVDENFIKNKELIRMDMNIIQFPIFSKNTKRKVNQVVKYFFNKNKDTYITVTPSAGDYIPGELEERVFIALMQIMKERNMPQKFVVTATEIRDKLKMPMGKYNATVKKSLLRLATSNYAFKNTLYSSEYNGVISEEIRTTMLTIRIITLSLKENSKYRDFIGDKRVKEIYEISMSDQFYKNIIQKGYMVYNGNTLLEIESSTARTIYMLIEKLRFDKLYLKLDTIFLIKRIPLKQTKKNIDKNIKTLEKAFNELVSKNLIESFKFIKESTWEKSEIEIYFNETANDDKQERFFRDRNDLRKMLCELTVSGTEHDVIEEEVLITKLAEKESASITREKIEKILDLMPSKAKELKTLPKAIKEAIEKYGYSKVESVANYMKKQKKVEKIRAYFLKALEEDWVDEVVESEKPLEKPLKQTLFDFNMNIPQYNEKLYTEFEKLPIEIQNGIETYAYREYIKECGIETKIQRIAFAGSRKKYICEYLEKYPEILGNMEDNEKVDREESKEENYLTDLDEIQEIIKKTIKMASMVNDYTEDESKEILKVILQEIIPYIKESKLTKSVLDRSLKEHTGF